jgi:hypothetical protein
MKTFWISSLLILLSSGSFAQNHSIKNLIGRWESSDGAALEVVDSSRIFIVYGEERKPILSYQADFSKSPMWFDFVVKDSAQKVSTMKSLLSLENDNTLKWQVFEDGDRPLNFTPDKGDIVILRRKK